jgi:uncharacterized protein (DUF2249 family)
MPDQELDVRPLRKPEKHPEIFRTFEALTVGESFVLINNHDPRHLREEFEAHYPGGYGWDYLERGPAAWRIRISRLAATSLPRVLADARQLAADAEAPDAAGAVWKLGMRQRDLDSNVIRLHPGATIRQPYRLVGRLVTDPADLTTQHRVLVPEDQQFGILGHLTSAQHHKAGEQTAQDQIDAREDHSEMISAWKMPPARPDRIIEPHRVRTQHLPPPTDTARELGFPGLAGLLLVVPLCFMVCRCEPLRSSGYGHMADGIGAEQAVHRTACPSVPARHSGRPRIADYGRPRIGTVQIRGRVRTVPQNMGRRSRAWTGRGPAGAAIPAGYHLPGSLALPRIPLTGSQIQGERF